MKKVFHIVILILISTLQGNSQQLDAGIQAGFGTYSMKDLKMINSTISSDLPFDTKVVEDFPIYFYYRPYILVNTRYVSFGPVYTFQSTGSRVSGKDYSGEYRFDMMVNSSAPGIYGEVYLKPVNKVQGSVYTIFGGLFSNLKMNEYLVVQDEVMTDDDYSFKSSNFFLEPGFNLRYPVKFLKLGINAGYLFQFGGKSFYFADNKDAELINNKTGDPVKSGWNGFRIGLSVSCILKLSPGLSTD